MDVVGDGIARDPLELMGEIIGTHPGLLCQLIQGQLLHVVGMDIVADGVDPFGNGILRVLRVIDVAVLETVQPEQELREDAVQKKLVDPGELLGPGMAGKLHDPVDQADENSLLLIGEPVDGKRGVKGSEHFLVGIMKAVAVASVHKGDDEPS